MAETILFFEQRINPITIPIRVPMVIETNVIQSVMPIAFKKK